LKQALITMLDMQDRMNTRVHPQWVEQNFEWYRAVWIECGELIDHYGYKWWKKQQPEMEQVRLEVIDIWHFGMSALFDANSTSKGLAEQMLAELEQHAPSELGVREATEALALNTLEHKGFSVALFWDLMAAVDLSFDELYSSYVGKNVLNFFRQDHGYKEGSYQKTWQGREDNEHLVDLVNALDKGAADFADQVYSALEARYAEVTS